MDLVYQLSFPSRYCGKHFFIQILKLNVKDDDDEVYDSISDDPKLFSQSELNDLVRYLNLTKDSAEVLGSRLKEQNLLAPGTSFSWFRNRKKDFLFFFFFLKLVNLFIVTILQAS